MVDTIIIGGAPCAGKSTLASALADRLGVKCFVLDELRETFQKDMVAEKEHYPWMYSSHDISAEDFWRTRWPEDLVQMEIEQAREYWPILKKRIETEWAGIFEGVSVLPELLWRDYGKNIRALFLIDPDRRRVQNTIQTRGLWGDANSYADWIKPLELEWVMLHNEWFRQQAKKFPYPLIEVQDRPDTLAQAEDLLGLA